MGGLFAFMEAAHAVSVTLTPMGSGEPLSVALAHHDATQRRDAERLVEAERERV